MKNEVRNVGERGHKDSLAILLFLIGRPLVFALGIYAGVLLKENGFDSIVMFLICMLPTLIIEISCTNKMKEKIQKQKRLYTFKPSTDIGWNIEKHKEYERIRKSELKWWEFWL